MWKASSQGDLARWFKEIPRPIIVSGLLALVLFPFLMPANTSQDFVPAVVGWGGARLEDAHLSRANNTISEVFPSQKASNLEMQVQRLASLGYNGFRVDFESQCTNWKEDGPYNATNLERAFSIAEHFNFWIIVDYHGFNDTSTALSTN